MIAQQLIDLGFTPFDDFLCQDDGDGRGAYISEWISAQPCPFPELIRAPIALDAQ